MLTTAFYSLREIERRDLDMVRRWRNSEKVRKFSYTSHEISSDEHEAWFGKLQSDEKRKVLIFEYENEPVGVIQFFDIDPIHRTCKWGFYLGPEELPKGLGTTMGKLALSYAFEHLKVEEVYGEALANNEKSIGYHKKLGFSEVKRFVNQVFRDGHWIDAISLSVSMDDFFHQDEITWPTAKEWH